MYKRTYTPSEITSLEKDEVFVFGTNPEGNHKSTAAVFALNKFGAKMGKGEGLFGQSYAIPVHKRHTLKMVDAVKRFIKYANNSPNIKFYVTAIGCGAAGMDPAFVALMFRETLKVENIFLPKSFVEELNKYYEIGVEISGDCLTIIRFPMHNSNKYVVPYGIECLGESSFLGCCCQLQLPETLKRIEKWAFSDMGGEVRIPNSVSFIDDKAFECEFVSPIMLVKYEGYAYHYAKRNKLRYKCIDFDEERYLQELKACRIKDNPINYGLKVQQYEIPIPKGRIAIARDFAIVLNDNGNQLLLGHNEDFRQLRHPSGVSKLAAAYAGYMALTNSGNIVTGGNAREFEKAWDIENLRNVKDIVASEGHTLALLKNGQVECIDENGGWEGVPQHSKIVKRWLNVKQVAVGFCNVMALTNNGKVLYHSVDPYTNTHFYDNLCNVVQVDCYSHYYGADYSAVLHSNGTVASESFEGVESWRDIVQISVGADIIMGLKRDGTIEMIDNRGTRYKAKEWKNISCIECKFFGVVGITNTGEMLSLYQNY